MKQSLSSNAEACHVWASQSQDYGYSGNVSFKYGVLFSYNAEIAHIVDGVALLSNSHWSVTTSAHQNLAHSAVSHLKKFHVYSVKPDHKANCADYIERIKGSFERFFRARKNGPWIYDENQRAVNEFIDYCQHFKVKYPARKIALYILASPEQDETLQLQKQAHKEAQQKAKVSAKRAIKRAENAWIQGKSNQAFAMSNDQRFDFSIIKLRKNDDDVVTSLGARVPLREAKILYKAIKAGKPVHGQTIGHYTVISLNGSLKIGCHNIGRGEIDRFAKVMQWN